MNKRKFPLNAARAFESTVRLGSITEAANELYVTQGAVSRQVKKLEQTLGVRLVQRGKHSIVPSSIGAALAAELTSAFDAMDAALLKTQSSRETLRLQTSPSFAIRWLVPKLELIQQIAPDLDFAVTETLLHDHLDNRSFDAGIIYGDGEWPDLEKILLQREYLVPVVSPALTEQFASTRTIADLSNFSLLYAKVDHSDWSNWIRMVGAEKISCKSGPAFETMDSAIRAAENGFGIALGNLEFVRSSIEEGKLTIPFGPVVYCGLGYYLVYPKSAHFSETIKNCFDWICKHSSESLEVPQNLVDELHLDLIGID